MKAVVQEGGRGRWIVRLETGERRKLAEMIDDGDGMGPKVGGL